MFQGENEDDSSDGDQEPNDDDGSSEDEVQVEITAGNARYYDNSFPSRLRRKNEKIYWHKNLELLLLLNMKWMPSKDFTDMKLYFRYYV